MCLLRYAQATLLAIVLGAGLAHAADPLSESMSEDQDVAADDSDGPGPDSDGPIDDAATLGRPREVIQNRKYELAHEISLLGGGLPVDPYYKGITVTAGYTYHINTSIAWEVVQLTYSYNIDTGLKENLAQLVAAKGGKLELPEIQWIAASHLVLKPFYGKQAFLDAGVVHLEAYLQGGPAVLGLVDAKTPVGFGADVGFGVRLWLSEGLSVRIDATDIVYLEKAEISQAVHLHGGLSFNLWGDE